MIISKEKFKKKLVENEDTLVHSLLGIGGLGWSFAKSFLSTQDKARLSSSCSSLYGFFKEELTAEKLLRHVVRGEQDQAQAMIAANPSLLLVRIKTNDYSGRTIKATPFQAALGAEDELMWQMMLPFFEGLPEGKSKAWNQFNQQFPDGLAEQMSYELENTYDFGALIVAIINGTNVDEMLTQFKKDMTKDHVITHGKHFNMQHLISAYKAYIDNYDAFGNWYNRNFFWQKVLGFVQRQMPANYAQAFCSGLSKIVDNSKSLKRTFIFDNGDKFFPLSKSSGLGFYFACYSYYQGFLWCKASKFGASLPHTWHRLKHYVAKKQTLLSDLEGRLSQTQQVSPSAVKLCGSIGESRKNS
jgi:hypothetical protein